MPALNAPFETQGELASLHLQLDQQRENLTQEVQQLLKEYEAYKAWLKDRGISLFDVDDLSG